MATELTVQSERAFQKQPHIFLNQKGKAAKSKRVGKGGRRWFKDVGLGFKTPKTAIEGTYIGTAFLGNNHLPSMGAVGSQDANAKFQTRNVHSQVKSQSVAVS